VAAETGRLRRIVTISLGRGSSASGYRKRITEFAAQNQLVMIFPIREYVEASGLMSYGLNFCEHYGRATYYVDGSL
jgi:hypothetical protein